MNIAGQGDSDYVAKLSTLVEAANAGGADIKFAPRWLSDEELADLLAASDVCVFPFARVDNSGSILLALVSGLPVIIPDLPSLLHIDNPAVLRFDHTDSVSALSDAMMNAAKMDEADRIALGRVAREWSLEFNWSDIATQTAAVYARTVQKK